MTLYRWPASAIALVSAVTLIACGSSGSSSLTAPGTVPGSGATPTTTALSVTFSGSTIFIGESGQFEAREALSNGTSRTATGVAWTSQNANVATVSPAGLVTGVAAGETTIAAEANGARSTLAVRVLPNFGGAWTGSEVATGCEDSGAFTGFCVELGLVGDVFRHASVFTQTGTTVTAVLTTGDDTSVTATGIVVVDGELSLPSAPILPADPELIGQVENWRSRADVPGKMTGTYTLAVTVPGVSGSVRVAIGLQNVVKTGTGAMSRPGSDTPGASLRRRIASRLHGS
jgi:hypothetical protein